MLANRPIGKQLFDKEAAGENIQCAHQIFEGLFSLITSSADVKHMNERLLDSSVWKWMSPLNKRCILAWNFFPALDFSTNQNVFGSTRIFRKRKASAKKLLPSSNINQIGR